MTEANGPHATFTQARAPTPFVNAAAEYPDPASPVRQAISARRVWYHNRLENLLAEDGDPAPSLTASLLVALSDGLLESAYLDDAESVHFGAHPR